MLEKKGKTDLKAAIAGSKAHNTYAEQDRKKGGRPPLSPEQKKSKNRITIYMTDAELEEVTESAENEGLNAQAFMKMITLRHIRASKSVD